MGAHPLSDRELKFIEEYLKDGIGAQAAIRAGYAKGSATVQATRLLKKEQIRLAVDSRRQKVMETYALTADRIDREIAHLAFADMRGLYNPDGSVKPMAEWPEDAAAAVAAIETEVFHIGRGKKKRVAGVVVGKIKRVDKASILTLAARRLGLLKDKLHVTGELTLEQLIGASIAKPEEKA